MQSFRRNKDIRVQIVLLKGENCKSTESLQYVVRDRLEEPLSFHSNKEICVNFVVQVHLRKEQMESQQNIFYTKCSFKNQRMGFAQTHRYTFNSSSRFIEEWKKTGYIFCSLRLSFKKRLKRGYFQIFFQKNT